VERGLLLLRVRDELRMTLHAYQTLYESSIAFGIRKALQAEQVGPAFSMLQIQGPIFYDFKNILAKKWLRQLCFESKIKPFMLKK
jgi:hypothetical protein